MAQPDASALLKRTPLHAAHVRLGARMIGFGGWDMPVQYSGIVEEHRTVRAAVGCFDVSHMGEFEFRGPDAARTLQRLTTNDVGALEVGQVQYSLLCYEDGGIVDDLTLYRLGDDHYMMTVNAANIDKDWAWITGHQMPGGSGGAEAAGRSRRDQMPGGSGGAEAAGRSRRDQMPGGSGGAEAAGRSRRDQMPGGSGGAEAAGRSRRDQMDVEAKNVSAETGLIAVQGPRAEGLVGRLADVDLTKIGYYRFTRGGVAGVPAIISRTGYTGEDGFELYLPAADTERVWETLLREGKRDGVAPIGLGARDTLRLEMKYALYGNDIDPTTNPLEAGLGWVVKLDKGDFIGKAAIERVKADGPRRRLVGFEMVDRAVARHGYRLLHGGAEVGHVTSGSYAPSVDRYIGVGYVAAPLAAVGTELEVEVRGRPQKARVVKTPFRPPRVKQ